jgi:hypothetical protein
LEFNLVLKLCQELFEKPANKNGRKIFVCGRSNNCFDLENYGVFLKLRRLISIFLDIAVRVFYV